MTELDTKLAAYVIWGVGTVLVYGIVLGRRRLAYLRKRTRRSRQDLLSALGLFVTSLCAFLAITAVFWSPAGQGARGFFVAVALGAFFAAGVVKLREDIDG